MLQILRSVMGNYVPVVSQNGDIYPDYEYIVAFILLVLVFYWLLKFLFSLFK